MKKRVHKNQIVITTLAVLIAVAGYVTYDKKGADIKDAETVANMNQGAVSDQADKDYETGEIWISQAARKIWRMHRRKMWKIRERRYLPL